VVLWLVDLYNSLQTKTTTGKHVQCHIVVLLRERDIQPMPQSGTHNKAASNLFFAGPVSGRVGPHRPIFVHRHCRLGAKLARRHAKVLRHLGRQLHHPVFALLHRRRWIRLILRIIVSYLLTYLLL